MRQLMGINGENIFLFLKANCSEFERMNERQKPEKPLALDEFTVRFPPGKGFSVYRLALDATRQGDDVAG